MPNFWTVLNEVIADADVILMVLDARMPDLTRNKEIEDKVGSKPLVLVLNKCDLITKEEGDALKKALGSKAVFVSTTKFYGLNLLKAKIHQLTYKKKGEKIKVGVVGYPNTGKSSLINALVTRNAAKTSPHSGFTKGKQLVRLSSTMYLIDTPGVIPYKENDELKHSLIASTNPQDVKDPESVAMEIIKKVMAKDPGKLKAVYGIDMPEGSDEYDTLLAVGKKANLLAKGGEVDERRAGERIIQDWQRGKLA